MKQHEINRRRFLTTTAAAAATMCVWRPTFSTGRAAEINRKNPWNLDLNGAWQVSPADKDDWIPAIVPGCIHTDLMAAGKISDPFYRDNERAVQWVGETAWIYKRAFDAPAEIFRHGPVLLHCEGLDTLAAIKINGAEIGRADNMFRTWEFDVKPALHPGQNIIEVRFATPFPMMKERNDKRPLYEWIGPHESKGRAWVRKEPCNFGWDWGPVLVTCGIWRGIRLEIVDPARLEDVLILQDHSAKDKVGLVIQVAAQTIRDVPLRASISVSHKNHKVTLAKIDLSDGRGRAALEIKHPKLWWPSGMGEQPLYGVRVELLNADDEVIDSATKRIGLRTLKMLPPDNENPLRFEVNGVPFFAKGANWIPADAFANRVTPEISRRYVADAVAVNMNMLRFWGGGYYEDDALFDACDEMGVCVWLDFKFACSSYPAFDDAFMENVRLEARDNLRRLRHHACIAVWCGNNEISLMTKDEWSDNSMGRADYDKLFKNLLAQQVAELAPQADYVSGSPDCGDTHNWQVWHGNQPFSFYRNLTGFMSEFGFQSFPEPKTVRAFTTEADRESVLSPVMKWHERNGDGKGCEKIQDTMPRYFNAPKNFESALWLSQIQQALAIKTGVEFWRQTMPKSMGCIFWQYNDCWPVASWSSVDYFGRWKALHYAARRFYAPILISGLENPQNGTIDIYVTSDRLESCHGQLTWEVTDLEGKSLLRESARLEIAAQKSSKVKTLELQGQIRRRGANGFLTWLKLAVDRKVVSENLVSFVPPKELKLADPKIAAEIDTARDGFLVTLKSEKPALWAWLDLQGMDAKYSDNFVHLAAGTPSRILVRPNHPMTQAGFVAALHIRSLFDTYSSVSAGTPE